MIVLFVKTRNQADLLRLNLAHHLGWSFDHVIIADNQSTDATQDVLHELRDGVTVMRTEDPNDWSLALSRLLHQIEERHGNASWVGVSDTDEFWWTPNTDLRSLLAGVTDDVVAVNSDQKLFLPTELDPPAGPVYCRRTFRTSGGNSPLHTSYVRGKSLYRGTWIRNRLITDPHWSEDVPHDVVRFMEPLVHHYMIDDEDSFVEKVKSLERWYPREPTRSGAEMGAQLAPARWRLVGLRNFKIAWWRLYETTGEAGLREYYRRQYVISADSVPARTKSGELIHDPQFANFKQSNLHCYVAC